MLKPNPPSQTRERVKSRYPAADDNTPDHIKISTPKQSPRQGSWWLLLIALCGILGVVALWEEVDFLDQDEEGNPILSEERQRKLDHALRDLDDAEQYALRATRNGYYPCYNCGDSTYIHLFTGEVWRYGSTTKGERGRYSNSLKARNLFYFTEFRGTLQECLKQERIKIFNYATLPENLKRTKPLIRPPGNKIDR